MKAVIQRVLSASVTVNNEVVSSIGKGILVFAAVAPHDTSAEIASMAQKLLKVKMWDDENGGRWKRSVTDIDGDILMVSQFTLYATLKKGNKPDFHGSAGPDVAKPLYDELQSTVSKLYKPEKVKDGVFGAMMEVSLVNDGPVTFELEVQPHPQQQPKKPKPAKSPNEPKQTKVIVVREAELLEMQEGHAVHEEEAHNGPPELDEPALQRPEGVRDDIMIMAGGLDFEVETVDGVYRTSANREQMSEK